MAFLEELSTNKKIGLGAAASGFLPGAGVMGATIASFPTLGAGGAALALGKDGRKDLWTVSKDQALSTLGVTNKYTDDDLNTDEAKDFMEFHDNVALPVASMVFGKYAKPVQAIGSQFNPDLPKDDTGPKDVPIRQGEQQTLNPYAYYGAAMAKSGMNNSSLVMPVEVEKGELKVGKDKGGDYRILEDFANAPTHEKGGKKIMLDPNESDDGVAIMPGYFRSDVMKAIMNKDNDTIDSIREFLPQAETLAKNGIYIKPENRGKFTKWAKGKDMSVQEAASHILSNKDKYSSTLVKRANFAKNASKWKKAEDGINVTDTKNETIMAKDGVNTNSLIQEDKQGFSFGDVSAYDYINLGIAGTNSIIGAYNIHKAREASKNATKDWKPVNLAAKPSTIVAPTIAVKDDAMRASLKENIGRTSRTASEEIKLRGGSHKDVAVVNAIALDAEQEGKAKIDQYATNIKAANAKSLISAATANAQMEMRTNMQNTAAKNQYDMQKNIAKNKAELMASETTTKNLDSIMGNISSFFQTYERNQAIRGMDDMALQTLFNSALSSGNASLAQAYANELRRRGVIAKRSESMASGTAPIGTDITDSRQFMMKDSAGLVDPQYSSLVGPVN